jgi:hypothetical protein
MGFGLSSSDRVQYTTIGLSIQVSILPFMFCLGSTALIAHRFNRPSLAALFVALLGVCSVGFIFFLWVCIFQLIQGRV